MSEVIFDEMTPYLCRKSQTYHAIDLPVDYDFAERIAYMHQVEFFLAMTRDNIVHVERLASISLRKDEHEKIFFELFPEFYGIPFQFDYLSYWLCSEKSIDTKLPYAAITKISKSLKYKEKFSSCISPQSKSKQEYLAIKSRHNNILFSKDDLNSVQFAINSTIINNKVVYGSSWYYDCSMAHFFIDDFQKIFYNTAILNNPNLKTVILTDDLLLAENNHQYYFDILRIYNVAWVSWFSRKRGDVPTNLPWQSLKDKKLFWLFIPHSNQNFNEALQVLFQVEKQLENNGIPTAQLNIISYWEDESNRKKHPSIMTNDEFHQRLTNNSLFIAQNHLFVSKTEISIAKISDIMSIKTVIECEYWDWWSTYDNNYFLALLIIDFTGNYPVPQNSTLKDIKYWNTSDQIDSLNAILCVKDDPSLTVIIIGGIPIVSARLGVFVDRLNKMALKRIIIIPGKTNLKPILSTEEIQVTRIKSQNRCLFSIERYRENIPYKKFYIEDKNGSFFRVKNACVKRPHLSKKRRSRLQNEIKKYFRPPYKVTIKEIAHKLKITESLVKKIKGELELSKPRQKTLNLKNPPYSTDKI